MHFGRERCLIALGFAFVTAKVKKRSEKMRGKGAKENLRRRRRENCCGSVEGCEGIECTVRVRRRRSR